jgi:hypothetical protein
VYEDDGSSVLGVTLVILQVMRFARLEFVKGKANGFFSQKADALYGMFP